MTLFCSWLTSASFFCSPTVWSPPYVFCSPAWLWPSQQPLLPCRWVEDWFCSASLPCLMFVSEASTFFWSLPASALPSTAIAIGGLRTLTLFCSWLTSASFFCSPTVWSPPYVFCSPAWLWPSQQPLLPCRWVEDWFCLAPSPCLMFVSEASTFFWSLPASALPSTAIAIGGLRTLTLFCSWLTSASFFCSPTVWSPPYVFCSPAWLWPSQQPLLPCRWVEDWFCSASLPCLMLFEASTFFWSLPAHRCRALRLLVGDSTGTLTLFCLWWPFCRFFCSPTVWSPQSGDLPLKGRPVAVFYPCSRVRAAGG